MVHLLEVANIISGTFSTICYTLYAVLEYSFLVGRGLVNFIYVFGVFLGNAASKFIELVQVLYEDYSLFIGDIKYSVVAVLTFFHDCIIVTLDNSGNILIGFKVYLNKAFQLLIVGVNTFGSIVRQIFFYTLQLTNFLKSAVVTLGSSIWLVLTLIPLSLISLFKLTYSLLKECFHEAVDLLMLSLDTIAHCVNCFLSYFVDIPLDSVAGVFIGVALIFLLVSNFSKVITFFKNQSINLYHYAENLLKILWTGEFLSCFQLAETKNETEVTQPPEYEFVRKDFENKLCVICHDSPKNTIILPCRHLCLCENCTSTVRRMKGVCPICRSKFNRTMQVYL